MILLLVTNLLGQESIDSVRISQETLKKHVYTLASDSLQGRGTGSLGQIKAAAYCGKTFNDLHLWPLLKTSNGFSFFQPFYFEKVSRFGLSNFQPYVLTDELPDKSNEIRTGHNVIAFFKGTDTTGQCVVITAHYDHLGIQYGNYYPGADDDASGTASVFAIAEAFAQLGQKGVMPKKNIVFVLFSGEEMGLLGSKYFVNSGVVSLNNIVCDLNIDMVGRIDRKHRKRPDYCYLIGSDFISKNLHNINEEANTKSVQLELDYSYNSAQDPNQYYYRSDHYNFAKYNIPVIFFMDGEHPDYHRVTDTADKINYELLSKRATLVFQTAWAVANTEIKIMD